MKALLLLTLFTITLPCMAQLNVVKADKNNIPKSIKYAGHIVGALRYTDKDGDQIVVITETGEMKTKNGDNEDDRDAYIYAYHYAVKADSVKLTWRVLDFVKDCGEDITANFIKNTFAVTDLNNDGHAEVWMVYQTTCRGDVSPATMKIIMYEAGKKYAVRGERRIRVSDKDFLGGKYTIDAAFNAAPESFRQYAVKLWTANVME